MADTGTSNDAVVLLHEPTDLPTCMELMFTSNDSPEVRRTTPGNGSGITGRGTWVVLPATPGTRTYSLRYSRSATTSGSATFSNRRLWVMPL